jgi:hypothetical protein
VSRPRSLPLVTAAGLLVAVVALSSPPHAQAFTWIPVPSHTGKQRPAHSKRRAERNVLMVVARRWSAHAHYLGLINMRSNLLKNNVQAVCRGRGKRIGTRYHRLRCVVRPWPRKGSAGIYFSYRAGAGERFRLRLTGIRNH